MRRQNLLRSHDDSGALVRNNHHEHAALCIVALLYSLIFSLINSWEDSVAVATLPYIAVIPALLLWRVCLVLSELPHITDVCSGSYSALLKRSMHFNAYTIIITIIVFAVPLLFFGAFPSRPPKETLLQIVNIYGLFPLWLSVIACVILLIVCRWEECATWEAHTMKSFNGLDYGSGMAHSFFHGYLNLTLPAKGDNNLSIRERIDGFIEEQKLTDNQFPVKKLIILIPKSGYSFPTFSDDPSQSASDKDIEPAEALQDHLRNRAGTKARVYRGGAYRIRVRSGNQVSILYALAEGATPLLTFREAYSASTPEAETLRRHKADIAANFYRTLQHLIDKDPECRELVTLLYYDDEKIPSNPQDKSHNAVSLLQEFLLESCATQP